MRRARALILGVALGGAAMGVGVAPSAGETEVLPTPAPGPAVREAVPREKFVTAVEGWRGARRQVRALRTTLRTSPDFDVSLQLAGIAYGQDWRWMRRCALSEGAREAERRQRHNRRPNRDHSGAFSSFQFMRGTFLSTPFAALDWSRQDVQAHAAAWMWSQGRRGEWTGRGC